MKKEQLKKLIAPIVKECVEESINDVLGKVILEGGLLSSTISEVLVGMKPVLMESVPQQVVARPVVQETRQKRPTVTENNGWKSDFVKELQNDSQMGEIIGEEKNTPVPSISVGGINVFEGVETPGGESDAPPLNEQGMPTDWVPEEEFNILTSAMSGRWKKNMKTTRERMTGYVPGNTNDPYLK
jgi:hypothetical protein